MNFSKILDNEVHWWVCGSQQVLLLATTLATGGLEWVAIPFFRGFSQPRDQTCVSCIVSSFIYLFIFYHLSHQGSPVFSLETILFLPKAIVQFSSAQLLSRVWLFETPGTAAHQASLSITNSQSLFKLTSTELVMPSNCLILCCPLLLLPPIFPSIRVFSNESVLRIRWPKY